MTNKTILVVDDNNDMRENTCEFLELTGYNVIEAENGKVAIEKAKTHIPDLIICDIMMPELDGYGVLRILGNSPETNHIPFIFLSAKAEKQDVRKGMNMGADDYLTKPFENNELIEAVEARLQKSQIISNVNITEQTTLSSFVRDISNLELLEKSPADLKTNIFAPKDLIFETDKYPKRLFYILEGNVKVFRISEDGKPYIINLAKEGDFIGLEALINDTTYKETAEALSSCKLLTLSKEDFLNLLYSNKDVSAKFVKLLSKNIDEVENRLLEQAYSSVRKRVAQGLVYVDDKLNHNQKYPHTFSFYREDLAAIAGTAKETLIRTLSDFKEEKVIEINHGKITILNPDLLTNIIG